MSKPIPSPIERASVFLDGGQATALARELQRRAVRSRGCGHCGSPLFQGVCFNRESLHEYTIGVEPLFEPATFRVRRIREGER